jgi:TPR repeat protein
MYLLAHLPGTVPMLPAEAKEWLIRAAETGQAKALAELSTEDAEVRSRVLTSLKQRLVCDVDSLIQVAKIARIDQMSEFADATLQKASAIARGQPRYMHLLAEATALQEPGYPGDAAKAVALYEEAIAKGYGKSALSLAKLYATGRLGEKTEAVIALYQNAALLGEATATRALANYSSDPSNPGRASLATNALQQLAKAGNADAMQALGTILTTSDSTRFDEGLSFLKAAADNGRIDAMKTLARLFAVGVNGKISAEESTRWIKQAAEQGDAEAMLQYAVALDIGFGVAVNQALSQSWHKKAAQNGLNP